MTSIPCWWASVNLVLASVFHCSTTSAALGSRPSWAFAVVTYRQLSASRFAYVDPTEVAEGHAGTVGPGWPERHVVVRWRGTANAGDLAVRTRFYDRRTFLDIVCRHDRERSVSHHGEPPFRASGWRVTLTVEPRGDRLPAQKRGLGHPQNVGLLLIGSPRVRQVASDGVWARDTVS